MTNVVTLPTITLDDRIHCAKDELAEALDHVAYLKQRLHKLEAEKLRLVIAQIPI
jgi:hypothetical protein